MTRIPLLLLLASVLAACPNSGTFDDHDRRVDLEGTVYDPLDGDAPVAEAWIIVDTGDELITVRSDADGGFMIPDLPGDAPLVATVAAEDRQARTNADLILQDQELPMEVAMSYRDMDRYETSTYTVSGNAIDAPAGAWMLISGAGMEEYTYVQAQQGPTPFEFEIERIEQEDPDGPYLFSALAFNNDSGEILGAAVAEATWDDELVADLVFGGEAPVDLEVHSPAPLLDGEVVQELDSEYMSSLCLTYLNESWGSFLGWNIGWDHEGDGFVFHASYVPVQGHPARVAAYLVDDLVDSEALSYAAVPLEPGQDDVTLDPLDAPELDTHADFAPDVTVGWTPIDDVTRRVLFVRDDEGLNAWWISSEADEISFPRLPDEFDPSLLLEGEGTWHVRVSRFDEVDGELDPSGPYTVGETLGGGIELDQAARRRSAP